MATQQTDQAQAAVAQVETKTAVPNKMAGNLELAPASPEGVVTIKHSMKTLKAVDVADVDLLLTFANGDHVVIPNGALDALDNDPPTVVFSDQKLTLANLFKLVGVANPSKSGSLRLVTENIDANPAQEDGRPRSEQTDAPPAPMVKVNAGLSAGGGKGPGNGLGAGGGEGDVPATVVPMVTPQPAVYRVGKSTQSIVDLLNGSGIGQPSFTNDLYTSSNYKVIPSGRTDLPLGAFDPNADIIQLADRASPANQSVREVINGTAGADTIDFNPAFSSGVGQFTKTLHITVNNFGDLTSIQLVFNAPKIALIAGFDLVGLNGAVITRDSPTSNSWHVTPTTNMLLDGINVGIVYNVNDSAAPVDFGADIIIDGHAGPFPFQVINNLNFTWRDAVTQGDFTVTSSTGDPLMVLPRAGVGVDVFAGNGDDTVNAGAGPDIIHGEAGNDTLNGGTGNDVLDGGAGLDALDGGQGIDTATFENAVVIGVTATLDAGVGVVNAGEAAGDTFVNIENLTGSAFNDILIGDAQVNVLTGGNGDDKLIGRGNGDTLNGGAGTDTASYEYATAAVTVSLTSNTGTLGEADGDVLVSIENLIGGDGNDTFTGAAGIQANAFDGGLGISDTVSYSPSTAGVVASLTTGLAGVIQTNDAAGDTFVAIENLTGTAFADTLIGDGANNILNGGRGNNLFEGLGGGDTFIGALDNDTVTYAHSGVGVVSSLTLPANLVAGPAVTLTGDATGDTFSSIENLTGSAYADTLIGDANANILSGGLGDSILEGMGGADILIGDAGAIDTASYAHSTGYVTASLTAALAGFTSQGDAQGDVYTSIENLTGSDSGDTLVGDALANTLSGGAGDDVLEGLAGADILDGGTGNNTVSYEHSAADTLGLITGVTASLITPASNTGDAFGDAYTLIQNLTGSAFNDDLTGDNNNNVLIGGDGNDNLTGGLGVDTLVGGIGNDTLSDGLEGASVIDGGAGDDNIIMTSSDSTLDVITGGIGIDTLTWGYAGAQRVNVSMQAGTVYFYGPVAGTLVNFNQIENFTALGNNQSYVTANNQDNVLTASLTNINDYLDYRYATAGVSINLGTGVVSGGSGNDTALNFEHIDAGSAFADTLIGNDANNSIRGGSGGGDIIDGGLGNDTWYIDWNGNAVVASLLTAAQNSAMGIMMTGDAAGDVVTNMENITSSYSTYLYGDAGNNILYGPNAMEGFLGSDTFNGSNSVTSTASYANAGNAYLASQGITSGVGVGVVASLTTTAFANGLPVNASGDAAGDTYNGNVRNLTGSAFDDTLVGNASVNVLNGGDGSDILEGLGGADVINGGAGTDTVSFAHSNGAITVDINGVLVGTGDAAGDTFISIENIIGTNFNDNLTGNSGDNVIIGGLGNDTIDGGGGFDTASYATLTGGVGVAINMATNSVTGAAGTDTLISIERVIGSDFVDTITGTAGNDLIEGGLGADNIDGAGGSDTVSYASATGPRSVNLGTGVNTENDVYTSIENVLGSAYGDVLTGDAGDNIIEGGLGNDTLDGGAHVTGDTASYTNATAAVVANLAVGTATGGAGSDTLANFENLLGTAYDDTLTGDGNNNVLDGGAGNDLLIGGAGADTLIGGAGVSDTVSYATALAGITVTINGAGTVGDAAGDVLTGIERLIGSNSNDTITGDGGANMIDGGLGDDTINAGLGTDTAIYAFAASSVTVNLSSLGVNATGGGGSDTLTGFENIIGSGYNDTLTGDGGDNVIEGAAGADILDGGANTAAGDTVSYTNSNAGINVNLMGAANTGGHALGDVLTGFENITGSAFNDTLTGNGFVNILDGGAGDDLLIGGSGADQLIGGLGTDTVSYAGAIGPVTANLTNGSGTVGDASGDTFSGVENLTGSSNADNLVGDSFNNVLIGGLGNDTLTGNDGNDIIDASQGLDLVYGGNGDDTILVNAGSINTNVNYYQGNGNNPATMGGGDVITLQGLTSGAYSLTALANASYQNEILNIRGDGVSNILGISSANVQNFCDAGNGSQIWIQADVGDSISIVPNLVAGETLQTISVLGGTDYLVFNASSVQVAQIHWQTA